MRFNVTKLAICPRRSIKVRNEIYRYNTDINIQILHVVKNRTKQKKTKENKTKQNKQAKQKQNKNKQTNKQTNRI